MKFPPSASTNQWNCVTRPTPLIQKTYRVSDITIYLCFFIILYYKQTNKNHHGRRGSSFDFYKPKKRGQSKPLCSGFRCRRAKHFGATAFEAIRNCAAGGQWHVQSGWKDAVLSGAVAKLRLPPGVKHKYKYKYNEITM